ncbi:MAG TPA: hypothetical protein VG754_06720 [Verrucomicrobiae bacterium]|nr:hypothetical protein [Verrucomicrobiae bacterium]
MIKSIGKLTLATILAALVVGLPIGASAQDKSTSTNAAPATPPKPRAIPFHGKLGAMDKVSKTITLDDKNKRTFDVTSETKITKGKDKKPATLDDGVVGQEVSGSYVKGADGKMALRSLRFDPKGESK